MKLLLTGASGYIGKRLLPVLVDSGYEVICCVGDIKRFTPPESLKSRLKIIEFDLPDKASLVENKLIQTATFRPLGLMGRL